MPGIGHIIEAMDCLHEICDEVSDGLSDGDWDIWDIMSHSMPVIRNFRKTALMIGEYKPEIDDLDSIELAVIMKKLPVLLSDIAHTLQLAHEVKMGRKKKRTSAQDTVIDPDEND